MPGDENNANAGDTKDTPAPETNPNKPVAMKISQPLDGNAANEEGQKEGADGGKKNANADEFDKPRLSDKSSGVDQDGNRNADPSVASGMGPEKKWEDSMWPEEKVREFLSRKLDFVM